MDSEHFFIPGGEQEFLKLIDDLPFGQSAYQIQHLQLQQLSKERTKRQVLLEMFEKYKALKECHFRRRKDELKRWWLQLALKVCPIPVLRTRMKIAIEEASYKIVLENKLVKDAIFDFELYKKCYDSMPEMTREQYEKSEDAYWRERLIGDAKKQILAARIAPGLNPGLLESLEKIGVSPKQLMEELNVSLPEHALSLLEDGKR